MSLDAHLVVAERGLNVRFDLSDASTLALVGPNGAGKSTVLETLAGLVPADRGYAHLGGRTLFDTSTGTSLAPHQRGVAMLAQDALLFPRMSALDNVAFAGRANGLDKRKAYDRARRWLEGLEAADIADRRPGQLSGGQAQRVAIARALAAEPSLLLLDEPLAALDQPVAAEIRRTLGRLLAGRSAILVTHNILDAALLADHIAVMDAGRIVEEGATQDILQRPRTRFAAQLCGLNLVSGVAVIPDSIIGADGVMVVGLPQVPLTSGAQAVASFAPASVSVYREAPLGSPRNMFTGVVGAIVPQSNLVRIHVGPISADITPGSLANLRLETGDPVFLTVKAAEVSLYPA